MKETRIRMLEPLDDHGVQRQAFEIICHLTGDRAYADSDDNALAAAAQLVRDAFDGMPVQGRDKAARKSITIIENGSYQGILTELARAGWSGPAKHADTATVVDGARGRRIVL